MSEAAPGRERPLPRWAPAALSFVAGYVDVYTFLALFGLFVAQVTGSLVTGAAEMVTHDTGIAGKLIAVFAFIFAAALTAALIHWIRDRGGAALAAMLALETALLVLFTVTMLAGAPIGGVDDWRGIVAGAFGAMAMGTQSVIVRLLMRGVPQTNVMTGNMTSLGIETTELIMAWRARARDPATVPTPRRLPRCARGSRSSSRSPSVSSSAPPPARSSTPRPACPARRSPSRSSPRSPSGPVGAGGGCDYR
jgi:uncharacterized membrane protein YoaK (UPF0700 family)